MSRVQGGTTFRAAVTLGAVGLVGGVLLVTLAVVGGVLDRTARRTILEELARGRDVFADLQRYRESLFRAQARIVGDEPRLKAVVDTRDVNHETVLGVAYDLKKAMQSDLLVVTDGKGRLMADVADPTAEGFDLGENPVVRSALGAGDAQGFWSHDGVVFQVQAQRLSFGGVTVGVVVLGYAINDQVADTIFRQTGDSVAVIFDGKVSAVSPFEHAGALRPEERQHLETQLHRLGDVSLGEVELAGVTYVASAASYPGYSGAKPLRYVLLRSLDRAREPGRRLLQVLGAIAVSALLVAAVLALLLSRRLARPLDSLVSYTSRLSEGHLAERVHIEGPRELAILGEAMNRMAGELEGSRAQLAEKERLARDLELAARIQTSILPRDAQVAGLEIGARMIPAESVGGDYYDVFPAPGGAWIGIGDVAGHGVSAGLVMLMVQSVVSALVREKPHANPSELVAVLNRVIYENVVVRMKQDEHVTFTLLRYLDEGQLIFAGAHEEIVIYRRETKTCDQIATLGTWVGVVDDIATATQDAAVPLGHGDILVLYSDGLIQSMNARDEQFGLDRVCEEVVRLHDRTPQEIADSLVASVRAFASVQDDDISVLVVRRT